MFGILPHQCITKWKLNAGSYKARATARGQTQQERLVLKATSTAICVSTAYMSNSVCHTAQLARSVVELQLQCNVHSRALLPLINAAQARYFLPPLSDDSQADSAALAFNLLPPPTANYASQASSVNEQLYSNLHESQQSAHQCLGIASRPSSNDRQAPCHAIPASWQLLHQTPHHSWSRPGIGLNLLPQKSAHAVHTHNTVLARLFHSTASYRQHQDFSQDSSRQHGINRSPPNARPGFSRQPPPPSSNGASRSAEDQRRPPAYGSSQEPAQSGSQRPPFQQPPSQGSRSSGMSLCFPSAMLQLHALAFTCYCTALSDAGHSK